MGFLKAGDKVIWRGAWGLHRPRTALVTRIEITGGKPYGVEVPAIPWRYVTGRDITVYLDTGNWAYAYQIAPLPEEFLKEVVA